MNANILIVAVPAGVAAISLYVEKRAHRLLDAASGGGGWALTGPVLSRYMDEGGPTGALGLPRGRERRARPGPSTPLGADREVDFEFGTMYLDSTSSRTNVVFADDA